MTPGENGPSTPEDDDPFGYLYADGQARGAQPPSGGYGYPNSVSRVRTVGERQYGQPAAPQQQGAYGQPNAYYQAPETVPGGAPTSRPPAPPAPGRRGPNTRGLLIGAIAVVAAVVIGIGVAMLNGNSDDGKTGNQAGGTPSQSQGQGQSPSPSSSNSAASGELPKVDGSDKSLQLAGGAAVASDVSGARSADGRYVGGLNQPGASVTWTVNDIPEDGAYTLFVNYSASGGDQAMSVTVNGKPFGGKLGLKNWRSAADGDFAKGWTRSYVWPTLQKGSNTISISCQPGDQCNVLIDQLWIKKGQVKS
ncbi:carbohydrate-binding protein [Streptomyces sp. NPDC059680]|uniref:carbohydrate-binding protein n=1 Tax=Streptomyces TaxID=1883 RepID=UPI001E2A3CB1|nr:carbohydrate-binding protein [Streptomyces barringtoniae]MCC5479891.1 carbohydrate-binding protein [Streptomyces barringtoniae]